MDKLLPVACLFLDVGGVLLSDGWGRSARRRAAAAFEIDAAELDERHHLNFEIYELGKLSLDDYLVRVVFHRARFFSRDQFKSFMFAQSTPHHDMIALMANLKRRSRLKVFAINNEGRELNAYRIDAFGLDKIFDAFVSSCFVRLRKPDTDIFRLALDLAQSRPEQTVYIDNTAPFVEVAERLGMKVVHHLDYPSTREKLAGLGLREDDELAPGTAPPPPSRERGR